MASTENILKDLLIGAQVSNICIGKWIVNIDTDKQVSISIEGNLKYVSSEGVIHLDLDPEHTNYNTFKTNNMFDQKIEDIDLEDGIILRLTLTDKSVMQINRGSPVVQSCIVYANDGSDVVVF